MTRKTKTDLARLLEVVLAHLPLHAEEGGHRDALTEAALVDTLTEEGINREAATLLVDILRRQLDALAILDRVALSNGKWMFVSFPASLIGRSLLETLATPGQAVLPPDYWDQGDHRPQAIKEEQRRLLHQIESTRVRLNPFARPIRVVHVAWALIRLHGKFLLHQREDVSRPGEKTHVFPGGRFSLADIPADVLATTSDVLRQVFHVKSPLVDSYIDCTLVREIHEELGLQHGEHYTFKRWQQLPAYRQVNGAGNRHAHTEYGFQLYLLQLTPLGEVRLLEREAESSTLTWFSVSDLTSAHRADGSSAYVDALHAAWGMEVSRHLSGVTESGATTHALVTESETIDLPASPDAGIQIGKPGKERTLLLRLNEAEWYLLSLLGWHARGFPVSAIGDVRLLGGGWVRMPERVVCTVGTDLQTKLHKLIPGLLEIRDGRFLSLRIHPDILMFGAGLFVYRIEGSDRDGGFLTVARRKIVTPWAELGEETAIKSLNGNTIRILRELEHGDDPSGLPGVKAADWEKNLREQLASLRNLGLRRMWAKRHNTYSLVDHLQCRGASGIG